MVHVSSSISTTTGVAPTLMMELMLAAKEKFGNGNIKGVIGPEGANNSQKATSMITTVIFGIPGAKFAAILMSLFMYLGIELGTPDIAEDTELFKSHRDTNFSKSKNPNIYTSTSSGLRKPDDWFDGLHSDV